MGRSRRSGAAVVEFAVVVPLLFMVILGIIEFGRAMMVGELVNNAARTGCRQGVLNGSATSDIQTAVNNCVNSAGIGSTTINVLVNGTPADASTAVTGDSITVTVTAPFNQNSWIPTPVFLNGRSVSGNAVMRRE